MNEAEKKKQERAIPGNDECRGIMIAFFWAEAGFHAACLCFALLFPGLRLALLLTAAVLDTAMTALSYSIIDGRVKNTMTRVDDTICCLLGNRKAAYFSQNEDSLLGKFQMQIMKLHNILSSYEEEEKRLRTQLHSSVSDLVHQIRAPIANLVLYSGLLNQEELSEKDRIKFAARVKQQAEKLSWLGEGFSRISRLEAGIITLNPVVQKILPALLKAVEQAEPKAERNGNEIVLKGDQKLCAFFDAKWTEEVFYNLLDNAVKYGNPGSPITVGMKAYEIYVKIDVINLGRVIPPEEYVLIFQRFGRGTGTAGVEGVGLGLCLAREIIKRQGGYIRAGCLPEAAGTVFSVFLPKAALPGESTAAEESKLV